MSEKEKILSLMNFVASLNPFEEDVNEFLSGLLHGLMMLVPEADCGSAFMYEEGKVRFVESVGYDLEKLKSMDLSASEFRLKKNQVHLLKDTLSHHSEKTRKKFEKIIAPLKESMVFDLNINGKDVAGIGVDILKESEKYFSEESLTVAKLFKNLATNAFKVKLLQEELKRSEEKFRLVSEHLPVGIAMIDSDLKFVYVNGTASKITGYSKDELVGMNFLRMLHEDFLDEVKERSLKRLQGGKEPEDYDVMIVTKHGEEKWINIRSRRTLIFEKPMLLISALDIDKLKKIQKKKDEIMKRYEVALEASQISVFDYDLKRNILEVSKELLSRFNVNSIGFHGTFDDFKSMIHPEDVEEIRKKLDEHINGFSKNFQVEFRLRTKKGWKWVMVNGKIIERDEDGKPLKLFGVMSDVDTRKRYEEKLKEYATYDKLTGVYNRRTGLAILEEKIEYAKRSAQPLSVCFIDINNLKNVNDSFGHAMGDDMIKNAVRLILENIRRSDVLCRMGGDEFLVIFPVCTLQDAERNWNNVLDAISKFNIKNKKEYTLILSHGCAQYKLSLSPDELVALADKRMYEEKRRFKERERWSLR